MISCNNTLDPAQMNPGVSLELAQLRKEQIENITYDLFFSIPNAMEDSIPAELSLEINLRDNHSPLILDFKEESDHLLSLMANEETVNYEFKQEHIIIPAKYLKAGNNKIFIEFIAGDLSLNRNEDYLYTLLVPDRARTVFPCFDQPNLKAKFRLQLEIPENWAASANGKEMQTAVQHNRKTIQYATTAPISSYLFAFATGDFKKSTAIKGGRSMTMLYRETDSLKVAANVDTIFDLHAHALDWLEDYTGIPYPFDKFDFVLIPTFQYGGMEHVGNIFYRESSLFLDDNATTNQKLGRASLIAHETAHMWFGDLVTMEWFNDVWLKEVFANFMASKIVNPSFPQINHDLRFMLNHQPSAYGEDRSGGSHPIQQDLENLEDAGTLYGRIIYQKAPVVMRQLETMIGESTFQQGIRSYLSKFSFDNATWDDLIGILDRLIDTDLQSWNAAWVKAPGMPHIQTSWEDVDGKLGAFQFLQKATTPDGSFWPQATTVALIYPDDVANIDVSIIGVKTNATAINGMPVPLAVLPNSAPISYGYFDLEEHSTAYLLKNSRNLKDPLLRGAAQLALYEAYLRGKKSVREKYLDNLLQSLEIEEETLNRQLLLSQLSTIFWIFHNDEQRANIAPTLENLLWRKLLAAKEAGAKKAYFSTYQDIALSREAIGQLQAIYERRLVIPGLNLSESNRNDLAAALALRLPEKALQILDQESEEIKNPDRKKRWLFIMPALSSDQSVRDSFFYRLQYAENRQIEPWVGSALNYLHHPLRAQQSLQYIQPSLKWLEDIQTTGDIFFPRRWVAATLSGHNTKEAAMIVKRFLDQHPDYPYRLRNKILMSADLLFRSSDMEFTQ